jgi:branched-chain amino acid transport system ATP-binding protein
MSLLEIDTLRKDFGGLTAVDNLSFDVEEGEILGLIGPNGSGKTTVFNCVMSLHQPTSGTIRFDGEDITNADTHDIVNLGLARVSQHSNPIEDFTVRDNIRLFTVPNSLTAFSGGATDHDITDIAARVNIEDDLNKYPDSLPHAVLRRLEIAKALATDPKLLLLDEPFAGMNQAEVRNVSQLIEKLRENGVTIVIVDHNMKGMMKLVDQVIVLDSGRKIAGGIPDDVVEDPSVQQAYLADSEGI